MVNLGFGNSGMMGGSGRGNANEPRHAKPYSPKNGGGTDEGKTAKSWIKTFNVASFDNRLFAHLFVENARGVVIRNTFNAMFAVMTILSERLDTDSTNDWDEYHCAVMSKRVLDALEKYEQEE